MADANIAQVDSLSQLTNLLGLFKGKSQTSTTSSNISAEGMNALIQQILGGSQGLAAVSSGQKGAGLYNSTTNQQLTNDLVTRASGELAKQQAGTTTRTTQDAPLGGKTGQIIQSGMLLKSLLGSKAGQQVLSKTGLKSGFNAITEGITGSSSVPVGDILSANMTSDPLGALIGSQGWSDVGGVAGSLGSLADLGAGIGGTGAEGLAAADAAGGLLEAFGSSAAYDAAIGSSALEGAGLFEAGSALAGAGEVAGLAEAGTAVAEAAGAEEALTAAIALWVICTELHAQGKLSTELYQASGKRALTLSQEVLDGYHIWAVPVTRLLRKSEFLSRIVAPIARSRCEYLLGKKRVWGWLTVVIGEPVCGFIGRVISKKTDWRILYD